LKDEVARLARKEIRRQTATLQKASAQYRRDIAALKRSAAGLERQVALLERKVAEQPTPGAAPAEEGARPRFTAKGLRSQRQRLGLSAADYSRLVGVTAQSIYNWERGAARPRKSQIATLAALRDIGKKEARNRLAQLPKARPEKKKAAPKKKAAAKRRKKA
jgi:DNA-binding transcriptional regulator YiaG